jgi:hypothetical protein
MPDEVMAVNPAFNSPETIQAATGIFCIASERVAEEHTPPDEGVEIQIEGMD